ncbi:MAG TPA: TolC family protein [Bryobacteraceae bacterium]|nr:TolC family protein [Bryobacteraceae bacterium]
MKRIAPAILITVATAWAGGPSGGLTIDEAIRATMSTPSTEDLNVVVAESRVRFLEAMGRRRVEMTPQMGLLAIANPFAALTNLGAGLLVKQGVVPPIMILDARADSLAAQIAQKRRVFQREMAVTSRFYDLAEAQRHSEAACATFHEASGQRKKVERELSAASVTQAELIRHDLAVLDRESECVDAEQRRQLAATRLAAWVGIPEDTITAEVDTQSLQAADAPLREVGQLVRVAMIHRAEPSRSRDAIGSLRKQVEAARAASGLQLAVGGAHHLSAAAFNAGKSHVLAKLDKLDREMEELAMEIREQVAQMKMRFESQRSQLTIAKKRLTLSRQQAQAAAVRYRAGLENVSFRDAAETAELQSRAFYLRLEQDSRLSLAALMSVCGIRSEPPARRYALVTEPATVITASLP